MNQYQFNIDLQRNRDLRVMRYLSAGPVHLKSLHALFFKKENGKLLSRQAVERRLKKLEEQGRIIALKYHNLSGKRVKYYVLTELGANVVSRHCQMPRESIRVVRPPKQRLFHELHIARIIRTIWAEVRANRYQIGYMYDDSTMRQLQGSTKGIYYPDLRVLILRVNQEHLPLSIEFDGGTKIESYWTKKLEKWKEPTLMLCLNLHRMETMMNYIRRSYRLFETGFALADEFYSKGLANTTWIWLPGSKKAVLAI